MKYFWLLLLAVVVFAGCTRQAQRDTSDTLQQTGDAVERRTMELEDEANELQEAVENKARVYTLAEVESSGQSGTATIEPTEDGTTMVTLALSGGNYTAPQPAHIHDGTCEEVGEIRFPLTNVVNGESVTTINLPFEQARTLMDSGQDLAINVHRSAQQIDMHTACGDLE